MIEAVADQGFPMGGGGVDPDTGAFQQKCMPKMYAKTKELGPIGGRVPDTPPRSANERQSQMNSYSDILLKYRLQIE